MDELFSTTLASVPQIAGTWSLAQTIEQTNTPVAPLPGYSSLQTWVPTIMLGAGVLLLALVLTSKRSSANETKSRLDVAAVLGRLRGARKPVGKTESDTGQTQQAESLRATIMASEQVETRLRTLAADIEELSQRIAIEMDARAERLEELLALVEQHGQIGMSSRPMPQVSVGASVRMPQAASPGGGEVVVRPHAAAQVLHSNASNTHAAAGTAHATTVTTPPAPLVAHSHEPLSAQVKRLAAEGLSAVEIAKQLNQHTGKVELILALNR